MQYVRRHPWRRNEGGYGCDIVFSFTLTVVSPKQKCSVIGNINKVSKNHRRLRFAFAPSSSDTCIFSPARMTLDDHA